MKVLKKLPPAPEPTRTYRYNKPVTDIVTITAPKEPKNRRHRVFTNEEKELIFGYRENGEPYNLIAKRFDTTSDTIRHIVCREKKKRADGAATPTAQNNKK